MLQNHVTARAVSLRPLSTVSRLRSLVSPCEICGGQSGAETGFSPSTLVFPWHYHSTNAAHSSSS